MKTLSCVSPKVVSRCITIFFLTLFCIPVSSQLSGTYFISDTSIFKTFNQAVSSLNSQGVNGMVTFEVMPGTYDERIEIGSSAGTSESNQVTFRSYYGDSSQVTLTDSCFVDSNYVVFITENCTWLNFEGITFKSRGLTYGNVIHLGDFPQHIRFSNCVISGIYSTPGGAGWDKILVYSTGSFMDFLTFENNLLEYGSSALYLHGNNNGDGAIQGINIINNQSRANGYKGILMHNAVNPTITGNTFQSYVGIDMGACYTSATVTGNKIFAEDVGLALSSQGAFSPDALIANNFIYLGEMANRGISFGGGHGRVNIYHNTIITTEKYWDNYGIYFGGNVSIPNYRVKNNIIACLNGGSPFYIYNKEDIDEMDYNCYYTPGDWFAFVAGSPRVFNLEDFTTLTGFDENSYFTYPTFVSDTNLHAKSAWFNGKGTPLASVTTDIDGDLRDVSSPDIGADEYTPDEAVIPPHAGTYTIGSGGYFIDLDQALESLKLKGISAPVSLEFLDGDYILNSRITHISGTSTDNLLTITSQSGNAENVTLLHNNPGSSNNYILWIDGADFLCIRDLGFRANANATYGKNLVFTGGSENILVEDNRFQSTYNTNALANLAALYSTENFFRDFRITGNVFDSCTYGMYLAPTKNEWRNPGGISIDSNHFMNNGYAGIFLQRMVSPVVNYNHIYAGSLGMLINKCEDEIRVIGNHITVENSDGLNLSANTNDASGMSLIANNFITVKGAGEAKGINVTSTDYLNIFHNSVNMLSTNLTRGSSFYSYNCDHLSIYNNVFRNGGGGYAYNTSTSQIDSSDYNDLYTIGAQLAKVSTTDYSDLATLRAGTGKEANSVSVDPVFVSEDDLHLNADSVVGLALPLVEVVTDIDGHFRNPFHPDIGADELTPSGNYPPLIVDPIPDIYLPQDTGLVFVARLNSVFKDPNPQDILTYDVSSSNPDIMVSVNLDSLKVESTPGYNGSASIFVNAIDPSGAAARDTFLVSYYDNVNDPPVAVNDTVVVRQDSWIRIVVLNNDYDIDGNELRVMSYVEGDHGDVTLAFGSNTLVYDPDDGYTGEDTVQYVISDLRGGYDTAKVFITITVADMGPFEQILVNFDSVAFGNAIWGDIDMDYDYDIVVCGEKSGGTNVTSLYLNDNGFFVKSSIELEGVSPKNDQAMAFTDLTNNGYLDLIITGENNTGHAVCNLYIYSHGTGYEKYETDLPGVYEGSVDWGDYDNDGDPDLLLTGKSGDGSFICEIYKNLGKSENPLTWNFISANNNFWPLKEGTAKFIDFNKDDYLDVICTGIDEKNEIVGYYYTNAEGMYILGQLNGNCNGSIEFCDYDADGNIEVLTTGDTSIAYINPVTRLLKFGPGDVTEVETSIENVYLSSADWGDFDGDGDYDLLLCGKNDQLANITVLYENRNDSLVNSGIYFPGMAQGTVNWGDYDFDGDLDILLSGYISSSPNRITVIYKNNSEFVNTPPTSPAGFNVNQEGERIIISWTEAADNETPSEALTYNVLFRRKKEYLPLINPLAHDDGTLKLTRYGNAYNNSFIINDLKEGALYTCSVQTIDAGYQVSEWADYDLNAASDYFIEKDFTIKTDFDIEAKWIDYNNDDSLELFIAGYDALTGSFSRIYPVVNREVDQAYIDLNHGHFPQEAEIMDMNNDNILDYSYGFTTDSLFHMHISGGNDTSLYTGMTLGSFDWGDYDNDGDEDLIMIGSNNNESTFSKMYRNKNGVLENFSILIKGTYEGDVEWVDFDNDGDLDIAITGAVPGASALDLIPITKIYRNHNGAFIDTEMELEGLWWSKMDFADYDHDGDMDMLICGVTEEPVSKTIVYQNNNNVFEEVDYDLAPVMGGAGKWVDLDNEGYMDILLTGNNDNYIETGKYITKVYLWDEYTYADVTTMDGFAGACITIGDYNRDSKMDFFIAGEFSNLRSSGLLFENRMNKLNMWPIAPRIWDVISYGDSAWISWDQGSDHDHPHRANTFNLRIGTTPGGSEILSAKASENGFRKVNENGNMGTNREYTIHNLDPGTNYYYAIQSIDAGYRKSSFAKESIFNSTSGFMVDADIPFMDKAYNYARWIDYDNDKDLDLLVSYSKGFRNNIGIYRNIDNTLDTTFIPVSEQPYGPDRIPLINDFNNDNDPDFSISETDIDNNVIIFENNMGVFSPYVEKMPGLNTSMSAWGDFNNNGLEDFIQMGRDTTGLIVQTYLHRNNNGSFESLDNLITGMFDGSIEWVDVDSDGDLDLFACGSTKVLNLKPEDIIAKLYLNAGGAFFQGDLSLMGLWYSDVDFGDFDNDGDPDMVYTGVSKLHPDNKTYICENVNGTFTIVDSLERVVSGKCKWANLNNDDLLDIIISGTKKQTNEFYDTLLLTYIYINEGGSFTKAAELETFHDPVIAVGDYNNDESLDIFIGGYPTQGGPAAILYQNWMPLKNTPPVLMSSVSATPDENSINIEWKSGMDVQTPQGGLSYNIRIGTTPRGTEIISPLSHDDGTRKVAGPGNVSGNTSYTIKGLEPATTYYYSMQVIDNSFSSSIWSSDRNVTTLSTEVNSPEDGNEILIYPNPSSGLFTLELMLQKPDNVKINLINQIGQVIHSELMNGISGVNEKMISIPNQGIYTLRISVGDKVYNRRIIKL